MNTQSLHLVAVGSLLMGLSGPVLAAPAPNAQLSSCSREMAQASDIFPGAGGLRVLVTRFVGQDAASEKLGAEVGLGLHTALPEFARRTLSGTGLSAEDLQVGYVPCLLSSHREARLIGQAWGADLVLWGQASTSFPDPRAGRMPVIVAGSRVVIKNEGTITAPGGRVQIGIFDQRRVPRPPQDTASFKTSLTVTNWRGLEVMGNKGVRVNPGAIQDLDFPRLASTQPLSLLHFILAVYAHQKGLYLLAANTFRETASSLYEGAESVERIYWMIGENHILLGDHERGFQHLEQAEKACNFNDACLLSTRIVKGWAYGYLGDTRRALELFNGILSTADKPNLSRVYYWMGELEIANGNFSKAASHYAKSLSISDPNEANALYYLTQNGLSLSHFHAKSYDEAIQIWSGLTNSALPQSLRAIVLSNIGVALSKKCEPEKADELFKKSLQIAKSEADLRIRVAILMNIGASGIDTLCLNGVPRETGERFLIEATALARKTGEARTLATVLLLHGELISHDSKRLSESITHINEAIEIYRKMNNRRSIAVCLNNLALLYEELENAELALHNYDEAIKVQTQLSALSGKAISLSNSAKLLAGLGRHRDAIDRMLEAASILVKLDPPDPDQAYRRVKKALNFALRQSLWEEAERSIRAWRDLGIPLPQEMVAASRLRGEQGRSWPRCPGLVVLTMMPRKADGGPELRPGDVLFSIDGRCLIRTADVAVPLVSAPREVELSLVSKGTLRTLKVINTDLYGVAAFPF